MAQARALTAIYHDGALYKAGDLFDYPDDAAKLLKGDATEGMELVTKKSTVAFEKQQAEIQAAKEAKADALEASYLALKAQLEADPTRGDLVQKVLDAEAAAADAMKEAAENRLV